MPGTLFQYRQQVQRFAGDAKTMILNPADLDNYINQARREVAMRSQCIRVLPRISGAIASITIDNGGTGYTSPTLVVSAPDSPSGELPFPNGDQARGTVTQTAGVITDIFMDYGGEGYFQPSVSISDPTGSGAEITPVILQPLLLLNQGQEVYRFRDINLADYVGVESVYTIRSVSILYTNYRYSVPIYSFSIYQAKIRQYSGGSYQYVPCFGSIFGRGTFGSLYMYPPPSQTYQMEIDCSCLPQDLISDQSEESIPDPWVDAIPFYAAYLAFLELQNHNQARSYLAMFDDKMNRFGAYSDKGRAINPYGRP